VAVSMTELLKAKESLKSALATEYSDIVRDAAIQRFEFCVELLWKVLKKKMGSSSVAPKVIIREAAQQSLIADPETWLVYIDARNRTSHTYNEEVAQEVFSKVKKFLPDLEQVISELEKL
jgi:nucleotidyltransferase substrate binding protein (TIGR01987 family)